MRTTATDASKGVDMKKWILRSAVLAAAGALSIVAPLAGTTADASLINPDSAQGCSGNTCMYLSTPSGGTVYVDAWAHSTSFYGHWELVTPAGTYNSPAETWTASPSDEYQWSSLTADVGSYCVTGWSGSNNLGTACESVE